jgi:hypothetical protein
MTEPHARATPRPPPSAPVNAAARAIWLDALSTGELQGCGHYRLLIEKFADYGLPSPDLPRNLVRAFFNYW